MAAADCSARLRGNPFDLDGPFGGPRRVTAARQHCIGCGGDSAGRRALIDTDCSLHCTMALSRQSPNPTASLWASFWVYLEGAFVNQAVPSTVAGDGLRVFRWRANGLTTVQALASVFMDRLSGAMGAAIIAALAGWLLFGLTNLGLAISALGVLAVLAGAAFVTFARTSAMKILAQVFSIAGFQSALANDHRFLASVAISIFGHCISGLAVYFIAVSIDVQISAFILVGVTCVVILVSMLPISFAGWGIREASFLTLLAPFGVNNGDAVLIGLLFGFVSLLAALPGAVSLFCGWGLGNRRYKEDVERMGHFDDGAHDAAGLK